MARDEDTSKEGVDFKWVPMKDSKGNIVKDGKGGAVKTRHFFTKAEKDAMKKPAAKAEKKAAPAKRKEEPTATSVKTPKVTTTRLSDVKGGRGDGLTEMARRAIDRADSKPKSPKDYTYSQWRQMSRSERKAAGLPVSEIGGQLEFKRFMSGITGKDYTVSGMNKGGAVKKKGKK